MIEEDARVVSVEAGALWVETLQKTGCGRCAEPGGCGRVEPPAAGARSRIRYLRVAMDEGLRGDTATLQVGDKVVVGIPAGAVMRGAILVYLLPLVLVVAGTALGQMSFAGDAGTLAGAGAGLLAGFIALRFGTRRAGRDEPVILRRMPAMTDCTNESRVQPDS